MYVYVVFAYFTQNSPIIWKIIAHCTPFILFPCSVCSVEISSYSLTYDKFMDVIMI